MEFNRRDLLKATAAGLAAVAIPSTHGAGPAGAGDALSSADMTLWYRQPARVWVEALPVGNGRLGDGLACGGCTDHYATGAAGDDVQLIGYQLFGIKAKHGGETERRAFDVLCFDRRPNRNEVE